MLIQGENRKDAVVNLERASIRTSTLQSEVQHQDSQVSAHQATSVARAACSLAQDNYLAQSSRPLQPNCIYHLTPPVQIWHNLLVL